MTERLECEFFLIRYVPDVARGEFANVGVLLREAGRHESAMVRFTRDWSRLRCLVTDVDTEMLEALELEIGARVREAGSGQKPMVDMLEDTLSNCVQIAPARACLAESVPAEMDQLMRMYVEPPRQERRSRVSGRAAIAGTMRREFERAGGWGLMRKRISAAAYTRPGDPLKLDCGYRPNGTVRMFQAVSLQGDAEAAKVLAYTAPRLRDGVNRVEGAALELTAVVEPVRALGDDEDGIERYRYGVLSMEEQQIRVLTVSDLPRVAETARRELRP